MKTHAGKLNNDRLHPGKDAATTELAPGGPVPVHWAAYAWTLCVCAYRNHTFRKERTSQIAEREHCELWRRLQISVVIDGLNRLMAPTQRKRMEGTFDEKETPSHEASLNAVISLSVIESEIG